MHIKGLTHSDHRGLLGKSVLPIALAGGAAHAAQPRIPHTVRMRRAVRYFHMRSIGSNPRSKDFRVGNRELLQCRAVVCAIRLA